MTTQRVTDQVNRRQPRAVTRPRGRPRRLAGVDRRQHGHGRAARRHDDQLAGAGLARRRSSAPRGPRHAQTVTRRGTMTSFPGAGLARRRSSAPQARPRGPWHAARSTITSLPASASRLSIDGHGGTCEPRGPWHDDPLAGAGLAGVSFPSVDRQRDRGTSAPRARPRVRNCGQ